MGRQSNRFMRSNYGVSRQFRRGGSTLELCLVLPVLLSVSFAVVEFGQFLYIRHCFQAAARDAARVAALSSATQAQLNAALTSTLSLANVNYSASWLTITDLGPSTNGTVASISSVASGDTFQISLSTTYGSISNAVRPLSSFTGVGVKTSATVKGMCTMVKE